MFTSILDFVWFKGVLFLGLHVLLACSLGCPMAIPMAGLPFRHGHAWTLKS